MFLKRIFTLDIAKAICIVLVIIGHYFPDNSPEWYSGIRNIIYSFHMPVFMFTTGYIYQATLRQQNYGDFVKNKFKRLMIPYFSISIIIILIKLKTSTDLTVENEVTVSAFYEMFYLPVAGFFLWFIYTLFLIYLIVPFFHSRIKSLILLILSIALFFLPIHFTKLFCLLEFKNYLIFFVTGMFVFKWKEIRVYIAKISIIIPFLLFIIAYYIKDTSLKDNSIKNIIPFFIALTGIWFISTLSKNIAKTESKLKYILLKIGALSYIIYLFHTTFEGFTKAVLLKIPLLANQKNNLSFIVSALIVISIGLLGPVLLEKYLIIRSKTLCFLFGVKESELAKIKKSNDK